MSCAHDPSRKRSEYQDIPVFWISTCLGLAAIFREVTAGVI